MLDPDGLGQCSQTSSTTWDSHTSPAASLPLAPWVSSSLPPALSHGLGTHGVIQTDCWTELNCFPWTCDSCIIFHVPLWSRDGQRPDSLFGAVREVPGRWRDKIRPRTFLILSRNKVSGLVGKISQPEQALYRCFGLERRSSSLSQWLPSLFQTLASSSLAKAWFHLEEGGVRRGSLSWERRPSLAAEGAGEEGDINKEERG